MTGEHATDAPEPDGVHSRGASPSALGRTRHPEEPVVVGVGLLAVLAVAASVIVSFLANLPFDPIVFPPLVRSAVATIVALVVAGALVAVALIDDRPTVRVGLLFAGIFGPLGMVSQAVVVPAYVAVAGGGALALTGTVGMPDGLTGGAIRQRLITAGVVGAVAVSLAAGTGLLSTGQWLGAGLALGALVAVGTRAEESGLATVAGLVVVGLLVYVSVTSPYVVGSALLVVFAVTGVPHILFALAVAGGVAAAVAGLIRQSYPLAIGAGLLVLAGVPVTFPRAMTVLLGGALVVLEWETPAGVSP